MDGNGRWAEQRHLPRVSGHKAGIDAVKRVIKYCAEQKIEVLTLFAFSSENWQRPATEVTALMDLFRYCLQREIKQLHQENIRLRFIGDTSRFDANMQALIQQAEQLTQSNTGMTVVIAINYGGRWDITQAAQRVTELVLAQQLEASAIDESLLAKHMCMADLPEPDLLIRSSGEQRISNFLLWQIAYTELYFSDHYWPDFDAQALAEAIAFYQSRQRRFGHISEQVV